MFRVVSTFDTPSNGNEVLLLKDNWNDWFTWITQFYVTVVHADGTRTHVGHVKIANMTMTEQNAVTHTLLPQPFSNFPEGWFSLGQNENYYDTLNTLGAPYRDWFLTAMRDCAKDLSLLDRHAGHPVLSRSLMRDIDMDRVRNRFHRLAQGDAALTGFAFRFQFPTDSRAPTPPPCLTFHVAPSSTPPTNVHVVIGRNGVGKSRCFDFLSRAFLGLPDPDGGSPGALQPLQIGPLDPDGKAHGFAGLVTVSFSPFDKYGPLVKNKAHLPVRYDYVGLINESAEERPPSRDPNADIPPLTIKSQPELAGDFIDGMKACRTGARRDRWARALRMLEADPLFEEARISAVLGDEAPDWENRARWLFRNLSSGHSIVLLIITKLIELVEEKSLVLIDEPEGHLHPPRPTGRRSRPVGDSVAPRRGRGLSAARRESAPGHRGRGRRGGADGTAQADRPRGLHPDGRPGQVPAGSARQPGGAAGAGPGPESRKPHRGNLWGITGCGSRI